MRNIYLVGMMGSGKSVTGKRLASKLGMSFVDLDELLQERTGQSIVEIFKKKGETAFRDEEGRILKDAARQEGRVVATGGGVILRPGNVSLMKQTGAVVYLETSLSVLWYRVKDKKDRPLLKEGDPKASLMSIFSERKSLYESAAHLKVLTDGRSAQDVAESVYAHLMEGGLI